MPAPYSVDLRQRIVDAYQAQEGSQRQLAQRFKVSLSFVRNLLRLYRQTGDVQPRPHGGGASAKLNATHLPQLQQLIEQHNDAFLHELCEQFEQQSGISVSVPTMQRRVKQLRLSLKKNAQCQ